MVCICTDGGESSLVGRPDFKSGWGSETVSGGFDSHSLPPIIVRTPLREVILLSRSHQVL
jgi:hypothetical protein